MAKNPCPNCLGRRAPTGDGHRHGAVKDRSQTHNPKTDHWVKRITDDGKFMDQKTSNNKPFKGVRKEK
ncbi:hypothetical protein KJ762_00335 [bacterium]|nr:hypothetical protein [bacterium]MBU1066068.1 hypothetical protein [bacterium]MBU1632943.1 hypothetical protein [bacterium]MBU1874338.1 hypothetical protein [bacterium]